MSTLHSEEVTPSIAPTSWRRYYVWLGVAGVLIVPMTLAFAFNSWSAPDDAAFVRMAFSQVAGGTIAIAMMLTLVVVSIVNRTKTATPVLILVAVIVTQYWVVSLSTAADMLLQRIG